MKYFSKIMIAVFLIFSLNNQIFSYSDEDFDEITSGGTFLLFADLNSAPLNKLNLNGVRLGRAWIMGASFREASLKKADLIGASAINASFRLADLENAYLSKANFAKALFFGANLKGTTVRDESFKGARGLTNKQKAYLRKNGAINVPDDLTPEEFEKEQQQVEDEIKSSFGYKLDQWLNGIFDHIFCCCKKKRN